MDHQQFDRLTRAFAQGANRRSLVRGTLGLLGSATALAVGRRQTFPAQTVGAAAQDSTCSPTNEPTITCAEINSYVEKCGVTCPNGVKKEKHGGCTFVPRINTAGGQYTLTFHPKRPPGQPAQQCARGTVSLQWIPEGEPQVTMLKLKPPTNACCQSACDKEYERALKELSTHEDGHVKNWTDAVAAANRLWTNRIVEVCASTKLAAQTAFLPHLQELVTQTADSILAAQAIEPTQANPIKCDLCKPAAPGQICCKDTCVSCPDGSLPDPETCQCPCAPSSAVSLQDSNALVATQQAMCCPEGSVFCNEECCEGTCTDRGECCPPTRKACGNSCCLEGQGCCESTLTCGPAADPCSSPCVYPNAAIPPHHHCPSDIDPYWCCPPECSCCPGEQLCSCFPGQLCCGRGNSQCYDTCCNNDTQTCAGNARIGGYCCPAGAGFNKDTLSCCAVGESSIFCTNGPEACCPINHPNSCECCGNCE